MTISPTIEQRREFVTESLSRTRELLQLDSARRDMGEQVVTALLTRLDQLYIPDVEDRGEGKLFIDRASGNSEHPGFPVVAVIPGETLIIPKTLIMHCDEIAMTGIALMREIDPDLTEVQALNYLIRFEAQRQQGDPNIETTFTSGHNAQVFTHYSVFTPRGGGVTYRVYQQPVVAFAMQDVKGATYSHVHPSVGVHELLHVDDYSRTPILDHRARTTRETLLTTEFRSYFGSFLVERLAMRDGMDFGGLWYGSVNSGKKLSIAARVEQIRRAHTTATEPFRPLPSAYDALHQEGLDHIY